MHIAIVTGSGGLVGSQAVEFLTPHGFHVIGIDNNLRKYFFGPDGSVEWNLKRIKKQIPSYVHHNADIRCFPKMEKIFKKYAGNIKLVVHAAAQPSHDWAAREPLTNFSVNVTGTMNLLELTRRYCPEAVFIFTSTNKVYGDSPNFLPLTEQETRWEIEKSHPFYDGIDESMSIDHSKHSLFGASKAAADILVQEYGRYFGMKTGCFRGGCMTGPRHAGAELHGFLSYLMKCCVTGKEYTIFGYKGKQVRDNIHSADLISAFYCFYQNPRPGEVYNIGGGRESSCSILEAIRLCEEISGKSLRTRYSGQNRNGDHIWYISNTGKFLSHYPQWRQQHSLRQTLQQIYDFNLSHWKKE